MLMREEVRPMMWTNEANKDFKQPNDCFALPHL